MHVHILYTMNTTINAGPMFYDFTVKLYSYKQYAYLMKVCSCIITSPPEGVARYCFHPVCLSVCLSVCLCVCPADILVFYFSAIRRDIDLKFMQDTYRVVLNSLKKIDLHRSKVKVTGTVHCFLNVQSYHKN